MKLWTEYESPAAVDCAEEIRREIVQLQAHGGMLRLKNHAYGIMQPITVDVPSLCLCGEAWACNTDPNGVFETDHGTKVRMRGRDYPAIAVGQTGKAISGTAVRDLGVQGDIVGMDTRALVDFAHPQRAAGLYLGSGRMDQCAFSHISFCGCASGVCAAGEAEIDACTFEKLNVDGCGNGFYYAPKASYYTRVRQCVVADNPFYGFYAQGAAGRVHNLIISECTFVRNGGAFREEAGLTPAAVLLQASGCAVERCLFDAPGTYWHYPDTAVQNSERIISRRKTTALYVIGNKNRLTENTFLHSTAEAICLQGDGNVLMNTIADGDVRVMGEGNTVMNLCFTRPEARLILEGVAAYTAGVSGVEEGRILRRE